MRLSYRETALIASSMAELLRSGVATDRIFALLLRHRRSRRAREAIQEIQRHVAAGESFYEGFAARPRVWPPYFLEVIRCSELAGMLHDGFQEGSEHFRKFARVRRAAHMLWLSPVTIIAFGWVIRFIAWWWIKDLTSAAHFARGCLDVALPVAAVVLAFLYIPRLRELADRAVLGLPIISETVYDLCLYQFTTCFKYLYIAATPAADIVKLAANAVGNTYLARQLRSAAQGVASGGSFAEALQPQLRWPEGYIGQLSQGELAGKLSTVLDYLARQRKEALESRVGVVRKIVETLVAYATVSAIALTILAAVYAAQAR